MSMIVMMMMEGAQIDHDQSSPVELLLLGTAQDGGMPQIRCQCLNCRSVHLGKKTAQYAVSLAVIDRTTKQVWLIDCSPDFRAQYALLQNYFGLDQRFQLEGIFLTHLHMGHYIGLYQFGRETMDWKGLKIYGTERVCQFFRQNQPWSTYIDLGNFQLHPFEPMNDVPLTPHITIRSQLVPHRAEFSDTVGYFLQGPNKRVFYCPDVDSWDRHWSAENGLLPLEIIRSVDYAFLDATFFSPSELPNRKIEEIPHPTVLQTMETFLGYESKLILIHFNHSNPLFNDESEESKLCRSRGIHLGEQGKIYPI